MINPKPCLIFLFVIVCLTSCMGPTIQYLGDTYPQTTGVKEYFDEKAIDKPYRVIGTMTNDKFGNYPVDYIRESMIRKAKEVGADGIIYSQLNIDNNDKGDNRTDVKAKLIKFE